MGKISLLTRKSKQNFFFFTVSRKYNFLVGASEIRFGIFFQVFRGKAEILNLIQLSIYSFYFAPKTTRERSSSGVEDRFVVERLCVVQLKFVHVCYFSFLVAEENSSCNPVVNLTGVERVDRQLDCISSTVNDPLDFSANDGV